MTPVRLKPAIPRSPVKHSTAEPLRSLYHSLCIYMYMQVAFKGSDVPTAVQDCLSIECSMIYAAVTHLQIQCIWNGFEQCHLKHQKFM